MKKQFLSLSLLLTIAAATSFANTKIISGPGVEEVFNSEFTGARDVSWSRQGDYQKATFVLAGHRTIAFYDDNNEFAGCIRDIFFDQLPITVMKAIDKRFAGADFQEVREITNNEGTSYLLVALTETKKYKVRVNMAGSITDIEKLSK